MKTIALLFVSLVLGVSAYCQSADFEDLQVGVRLKTGESVTVYGDYLGHPNPRARYTLSSHYYFQVEGTQVVGCGGGEGFNKVSFTKITLPGEHQTKKGVRGSNNHGQEIVCERVEDINPCDNGFPNVNSDERQIGEDQVGHTFWILTKELIDKESINGKAKRTDVNQNVFEPFRLYSRTFVGLLAVPFKYRFGYGSRVKNTFSAESTVGPCLGLSFVRGRTFDSNLWILVSGGFTAINPNYAFDESSEKKANIMGVSAAISLGGNVKSTQFGIVYGFDFADASWDYNGRPWLAFSVGFSFAKRPTVEYGQ